MRGGQGRHHLGVLRIVDGPRESRGQVRFQVAQLIGGDRFGQDTGRSLVRREGLQRGQALGRGGHDDAALGLVLDRLRALLGEVGPQAPGEQGEVEFGPGFLVGDEQISSPAPVVPPATGPRSTTATSRPARAAYRAQAAPTIPAPTTTTSQVKGWLTSVLCHISLR